MKKIKFWSMLMLVAMMLPLYSSCSKDSDDNSRPLDSVITGNWHSYHATAYGNGKKAEFDISKTGQYAQMYYEVTFFDGGSATFRHWETDTSGAMHWKEEDITYQVKGDIVTMRDSDGETIDVTYDSRAMTLCLMVNGVVNDVSIQINVYLRK